MLQEWSGIDCVLYLGMDHFLSIQVTKTQIAPIQPVLNTGPAGTQERVFLF